MRRAILIATLSLATLTTRAQWTIQDAHTKASLRGIHSLGNGVAWASGTGGTVLRTEDGGKTWQHCATPSDAEQLDFRGIQAFDNKTAIVMSSGKGDSSRIYKTTDGCEHWKLVFTNPDEKGFFDTLLLNRGKRLDVLGDPVDGKFSMFFSEDAGETWFAVGEGGRDAPAGDGAFAASNSSLIFSDPYMFFGTGAGTSSPPQVYRTHAHCIPQPKGPPDCVLEWTRSDVPLGITSSTSGIFSLAARMGRGKDGLTKAMIVAVGGTYDKPNDSAGNCATSDDGGVTWRLAATPPQGYRSSVAYDAPTKTWITVGPNGTDISTDDGRNWRPLKPVPTGAPDADKNWNALSLPFVVGPSGRIGILNATALKPTATH